MAKMKNLSTVEVVLFNFLRNSIQTEGDGGQLTIGSEAIKKSFVDLLATLQPLEKNKLESRAFMYLDIISWLESKIQGKDVQSIIREKFTLRT